MEHKPAVKCNAVVIAALVVVALAVRLAWCAWTQPDPPALTDPEYYRATAISLSDGKGCSVQFTDRGFRRGGEATALWPPGYSLFLAPAFGVAGDRIWAAYVLNAVVGALTIMPVYFIGRRLAGAVAGLLGAAMATLLPSFVFWTPVLMSETLFTLLFAMAIAAALHGFDHDRPRPRVLFGAGLFIGLAALVRGQALILIPIACAWWLIDRQYWRHAASATLLSSTVAAGMLVPWAVRNTVVMDSPVLFFTNFGYNLRIGHADYSTGRYIVPQDLWDTRPGITFKEREAVFNENGTRRAVRYALHHPKRELELARRKIIWLWRPDSGALDWATTFGATPLPSPAWEPLRVTLDASYLAVLALAGLGLLLTTERRTFALPLLLIGGWTALHVVFFGEPRYHLPLLVVLVPMAASTLVWAANRGHWEASGA